MVSHNHELMTRLDYCIELLRGIRVLSSPGTPIRRSKMLPPLPTATNWDPDNTGKVFEAEKCSAVQVLLHGQLPVVAP
jgi:hypothetical protein